MASVFLSHTHVMINWTKLIFYDSHLINEITWKQIWKKLCLLSELASIQQQLVVKYLSACSRGNFMNSLLKFLWRWRRRWWWWKEHLLWLISVFLLLFFSFLQLYLNFLLMHVFMLYTNNFSISSLTLITLQCYVLTLFGTIAERAVNYIYDTWCTMILSRIILYLNSSTLVFIYKIFVWPEHSNNGILWHNILSFAIMRPMVVSTPRPQFLIADYTVWASDICSNLFVK
jgi:hypothetical protein